MTLTVSCDQLPSTCKSFNYTWLCLHGDVGCSVYGYDGNGKIKMDVGSYVFNESISVNNKQIVLEGMGYNETTFNHFSDINTAIDCWFRQCYFTIMNLSYSINSMSTTTIISARNGGNVKFVNVKFISFNENDIVLFEISGNSNMEFINCIFSDNIKTEFKVSSSSNLWFTNCQFIDVIGTYYIYKIRNY